MSKSEKSYFKTLLLIACKAGEALKAKEPKPILEEIRKIAYKGLDSYQYRKLLEEVPKKKGKNKACKAG
jgi:hypothetical protein